MCVQFDWPLYNKMLTLLLSILYNSNKLIHDNNSFIVDIHLSQRCNQATKPFCMFINLMNSTIFGNFILLSLLRLLYLKLFWGFYIQLSSKLVAPFQDSSEYEETSPYKDINTQKHVALANHA